MVNKTSSNIVIISQNESCCFPQCNMYLHDPYLHFTHISYTMQETCWIYAKWWA